MPRFKNRDGERHGRLRVTGKWSRRPSGGRLRIFWECECDCGNTVPVQSSQLGSEKAGSCGCRQKEAAAESQRSHGMSGSPLYSIWASMIQRCHNKNNAAYPDYGGRGITVCQAWRESFEAWLKDVGPRPSRHHSLDRTEHDRGYEPGNVRWATRPQQMRNTRRRRRGANAHPRAFLRRIAKIPLTY